MTETLTAEQKKTLLKLARDTIKQHLKNGKSPPLPEPEGALGEIRGAFVTLHKKGELRGCIGSMVGRGPLAQTIRDMAIAAAIEDPRFPEVTVNEMAEVDIEISVLAPLKRIKDVAEIEVGRHGILMRLGMRQGVLLPQVATEWKWNREEFLRHTCLKAGLPTESWKDPETIIEIFYAEVFGERQNQKSDGLSRNQTD